MGEKTAEQAAEERYPDDPRNPLSARAAERAAYLVGRKDEAERARPVLDREALAKAVLSVTDHWDVTLDDIDARLIANAIIVSGIVRDAAEVRREVASEAITVATRPHAHGLGWEASVVALREHFGIEEQR